MFGVYTTINIPGDIYRIALSDIYMGSVMFHPKHKKLKGWQKQRRNKKRC